MVRACVRHLMPFLEYIDVKHQWKWMDTHKTFWKRRKVVGYGSSDIWYTLLLTESEELFDRNITTICNLNGSFKCADEFKLAKNERLRPSVIRWLGEIFFMEKINFKRRKNQMNKEICECLHLKSGHRIRASYSSAFNGLYCSWLLIVVLRDSAQKCFQLPKMSDVSKSKNSAFDFRSIRMKRVAVLSYSGQLSRILSAFLLSISPFCTTCNTRINSLVNNCKMSFPHSAHHELHVILSVWFIF